MKQIASSTGCHCHFPDTYRRPAAGNGGDQVEQSVVPVPSLAYLAAQVTVSGQPEAVEHARRQLRGLMPLTFW